jgi:hypothetical protein
VLRRRLRLGHPCVAPSRGDGDPIGDGFPVGGGDGRKSPPASVGRGGAGKMCPRGDGDGRLIPDGEFPVAIPSALYAQGDKIKARLIYF